MVRSETFATGSEATISFRDSTGSRVSFRPGAVGDGDGRGVPGCFRHRERVREMAASHSAELVRPGEPGVGFGSRLRLVVDPE